MTYHTQIPRDDMCSLAEAISTLLRSKTSGDDQITKVDTLRSAAIKTNPTQYTWLCAAIGINPYMGAEQLRSSPEKLDHELSVDSFRASLNSVVELAQGDSPFKFDAIRSFDDYRQRLIDLYPGTLKEACGLLAADLDLPITAETTGQQLADMVKP